MNETWLITGGTGSFGQKFTEICLREKSPRSIRIYSRGELIQLQMEQKFHDDRIRFLIGDVRDKDRLSRAMEGVDYVIHAAALKHVPSCHYNPREAVLTNIIGTMNVVDCAIDTHIKKAILISSDKACSPVNLYGKTKAVAESLFIQGNVYAHLQTRFSCTRYGNVIGSSGSVVPAFLEQKKTGTLKITDPEMTRFWLTLDQGAHFVFNCLDMMKGGEIFIPKLPSMLIKDIADTICPNCKCEIIGIRPGEKLHETLITKDESRHTREYEDYFTIIPEFPYWTEDSYIDKTGYQLPENYEYRSDSNYDLLTMDDVKKIIKEYDEHKTSKRLD